MAYHLIILTQQRATHSPEEKMTNQNGAQFNSIARYNPIARYDPQPYRPHGHRHDQVFADAAIGASPYAYLAAPQGGDFPPDAHPAIGNYSAHNVPRGYGVDLNGDGKFNSNKDGFISFDLNRDGQHSDHEVSQSRNLLKAFSGDFDVNADGQVDFGEMFQGYSNFFQARSMDLDRDGVLSNWELQRAGGSVVQKDDRAHILGGQDQFGRPPSRWRSYSLDSLPNGRRLDYLNPWNRTAHTSFQFDFLAAPTVLQ